MCDSTGIPSIGREIPMRPCLFSLSISRHSNHHTAWWASPQINTITSHGSYSLLRNTCHIGSSLYHFVIKDRIALMVEAFENRWYFCSLHCRYFHREQNNLYPCSLTFHWINLEWMSLNRLLLQSLYEKVTFGRIWGKWHCCSLSHGRFCCSLIDVCDLWAFFPSLLFSSLIHFFIWHIALCVLAQSTILKSVWLSSSVTQSTCISQKKLKWYVQPYEQKPRKYFPNHADRVSISLPGGTLSLLGKSRI